MERLDAAPALSAPLSAKHPAELSARAVVSALLEGDAGPREKWTAAQREELQAIQTEGHPDLIYSQLLDFAGKLEADEALEKAGVVYAAVVGAQPVEPLKNVAQHPTTESSKSHAQNRLDAIQGKGAFGGRAEFLLSRFTREATDPKVILPMMAGSFVYGAVRSAALGRLAATTRGAWYAQGFAARLTASSLGFAAEVPTFALSARALRQAGGHTEGPSLSQELGNAALTLGFLKSFAFAGCQAFRGIHGIGESGLPQRLASGTRVSQFALSQGAMFTGLLAAHKAEAALGWRPRLDGATTITDTLASMLSLSVGGHFGHKILGPRLAAFQAEARGRSELASRWTELAPGLRPLMATAQPAPGGMLLAMSVGDGRGGEASGGDPSRAIRNLRIDLSSKDAKPKARRKALEDLKNHLMTQLHGDPSIPEGAKALRELFEDRDEAVAAAAMEHYGTLFLVGYDFGAAELRQGHRALEKIRDDAGLAAARRKKAELALTYIEGGMELNDYAKLYPLPSTQPLPEPRAPRAIQVERLFQMVLPTQLRKMFLDPEAPETAVRQAQLRYLTLMRSRPVDLAFEAELLELKRRFGAAPGQNFNLETLEAQNAASAFVELAQRFSREDFSRADALTALRRIFTYAGHTRNPELLHRAFESYLRNLYFEDHANRPEWWHKELSALHEAVRGIQLVTVNPPSPWARRPPAEPAAPETLDNQTDMMILKAYVQLLRPLPTTHPTLAAGMQMLERLSRRRAGVEPMKTHVIRQLLLGLREEKIRSLPETLAVKGWGMDPRSGKPVYVDRQIDLKSYEIREIQTPQGPQVLIEGSDLRMQLPGTRQALGLGGIPPFLAALGLGLETLLTPNTALAGPLDPLVSGDLGALLIGATAAVSAALGFWAGWRARGRKSALLSTEVRKPIESIYRAPTIQGPFNFLGALDTKRSQVTAFHENGQPREILFKKTQTIQGTRYSAGITATVDSEGKLISMRATSNHTWHDALFTSDCRINDTTIPQEAKIFLTETGALDYVQLPFGFERLGAYNGAGPSPALFHENGKIKAFISSGNDGDPLKGRYRNKYVFFDQKGKFLGAGEQLSDYNNYVEAPDRLRIATLPREKGRIHGGETAAAREAEAEREVEASEPRPGKRKASD